MKDPVLKLSELLEKNHDAEIGYKNAAQETENHALKNFLDGNSRQRNNFTREIRDTILKLGSDEPEGSGLPDLPGNVWFNFEPAIKEKSNRAILAACEIGERAALEDYSRLLKEANMPEQALKVIKRQHDLILADLSKLKDLRSGTF